MSRFEAWADRIGFRLAAWLRGIRIRKRRRYIESLQSQFNGLSAHGIEYALYGDNIAFPRQDTPIDKSVTHG